MLRQRGVVVVRHHFIKLFGRLPSINNLKVFGCSTNIHLSSEQESWKLASTSRPGIIFGSEIGLYGIWNILQDQMVAAKNVIFEESVLHSRKDNVNDSHLSNVSHSSHEEAKSNGPYIDIELEDESSLERLAEVSVRMSDEREDL